MIEEALGYVARGWKIFPIMPGSKKPYPKTHGVLEASGAVDQIEEWWRRWPDAGIGIATGAQSGIVVLDIDPKNNGDESLIELQKRIGPLPITPEVITGGGGRHLYFSCDRENEPHNKAGLMGLPGLDVRGWHGYVVAPPSRNEVGEYVWDIGTEDLPYAPFPEVLVVKEDERKAAEPIPDTIPTGLRNDTLMSIAGSMRRRGLTAEEIFASVIKVAQRCDPIPPDADVWTIVKNAAKFAPAEQAANLPADAGGERDLVGSCLIGGNETVARILGMGLTSGDFISVLAGKAMAAIETLHLRGDGIDVATVRSEADRQAGRSDGYIEAFLDESLVKVPGSINAEQYAQSVLERSARRQILKVSSRLRNIGYAPADTRSALMASVSAEFDGLMRKQTDVKIMSAFDLALRHAHILNLRQAGDPSVIGLPPGFPSLDYATAYRAGEMWLIAARPTVGKTLMLKELQWLQAKRGVPSLFVSIEQPTIQLVDRNLASLSRVNSRLIQSGQMSDDDARKVDEANQEFAKMDKVLFMVDDPSMTTVKLDATIRAAVAQHGVRVVFVDYLQILADEYGSGNEYERISYISRRLKEIAGTTMTTIVVACQLSRQGAGDDVRPQLHHLKGSGSLEQDAYVVLGLSRPANTTETTIDVLKNRNGEAGMTLALAYDAKTCRFWEVIKALPTPANPSILARSEPTKEPVSEPVQTPLVDVEPLN
jgi:replicative DNA helicase